MGDHFRNIEVVFMGYGRRHIQEDNRESIGRNIAHWYRHAVLANPRRNSR